MFTLNPETMGDRRNRYCFLKNKKLLIQQKKKKKRLLLAGGRFFNLLNHLVPFKLTSTIPNRFFLVSRGSISVTLRFGVSFIGKKLVTSFGVDRLG